MSGFVKLRLGDLFDGPSDLITLPCSTDGTITPFVAEKLLRYTIPKPRAKMALGDVDIIPFSGAENIAQYVAFACSVKNMRSGSHAIESIGKRLGVFTRQNSSVRQVFVPLLGAGAGGMPSEESVEALSKGFQSEAASDSVITIHILHQTVYKRFTKKYKQHDSANIIPATHAPPRVFISYSGTSTAHSEWVTEVGQFLRENGINARLDKWHLRKGMDLPQWMTNELEMAERVVIISDARYADRADGRSGGVGWETMLIQGDMSNLPPESTKYIVIVREDSFNDGVPKYLKTKYCMHWHGDANPEELKKDLLTELYNITLEPPVGAPPSFIIRDNSGH